jgi:hypothetical protein
MQYLLIGGKRDGDRISLEHATDVIQLRVPLPFEFPTRFGSLPNEVTAEDFPLEVYYKNTLRINGQNKKIIDFPVYVVKKICATELINVLLSGYKNPDGGMYG